MTNTPIDTYSQPSDGWVCYHCGERFKTQSAAKDHFGERPEAQLACKIKAGDERGLVMSLRKAEADLAAARAENAGLRRYARHDRGCNAAVYTNEKPPCNCGFEAALAGGDNKVMEAAPVYCASCGQYRVKCGVGC